MTTNGDMFSGRPDKDEPLEQLFGDVLALVDETVAKITDAEVDEHLYRVLNGAQSAGSMDLDESADVDLERLATIDGLPLSLAQSQTIPVDHDNVPILACKGRTADRPARSHRGARHRRRKAMVTRGTGVFTAAATVAAMVASAAAMAWSFKAVTPPQPSALPSPVSSAWPITRATAPRPASWCTTGEIVVFPPGRYQLTDSAKAELRSSLSAIEESLSVIQVDGYADTSAITAASLDLSQKRAQAVAAFLETSGIPAFRLSIIGVAGASPAGQALSSVVITTSITPGC